MKNSPTNLFITKVVRSDFQVNIREEKNGNDGAIPPTKRDFNWDIEPWCSKSELL